MAKVTARVSYAPTPKLLLPMLQSVVLFGALFGGGWALGVPSGYLALYGFASFAVTMVVLGVTVPLYRRMGRRSVEVSLDGAQLRLPEGTVDLASPHTLTLTTAQQTLRILIEQPMVSSIAVSGIDRARASSHYPFAPFIEVSESVPAADVQLDASDPAQHALAVALLAAAWQLRDHNTVHAIFAELPWDVQPSPRHDQPFELQSAGPPEAEVEPGVSAQWPDAHVGVSPNYLYGRSPTAASSWCRCAPAARAPASTTRSSGAARMSTRLRASGTR